MALLDFLKSTLFSYETPKLVVIESRFIGTIHKCMQLLLFVVVLVWVFILNNGYQLIDNGAVGGTTTKLKGIASSRSADIRIGNHTWDSADLHVPPQENGAFFLTTNIILTHNQTQSTCPDVEWSTKCHKDEDCLPLGEPYHLGHGTSTGVCNTATNSCIVHAWCPIEDDSPPKNEHGAALKHTANFTVFIKNHVYFPIYDKSRTNLIESVTKEDLRHCRYHPVSAPYCPIFRLADIAGMAQSRSTNSAAENDRHFATMALKGAVVSVRIKWDCDFDYDETSCKPTYLFKRLDNAPKAASAGYNFRYPLVYMDNGVKKRTLVKAYGILFLIKTEASARAFEFTTFILNVGSALGLLAIASIISEICLLHIHRNKKYFKMFKIDPKPRVTNEQRKILKSQHLANSTDNSSCEISVKSNSSA